MQILHRRGYGPRLCILQSPHTSCFLSLHA
uniref:Uncharacterized protein n=1 Tax=Arundo donax TaxID=35708 RepID=A0A0A9B512_ARUDO